RLPGARYALNRIPPDAPKRAYATRQQLKASICAGDTESSAGMTASCNPATIASILPMGTGRRGTRGENEETHRAGYLLRRSARGSYCPASPATRLIDLG